LRARQGASERVDDLGERGRIGDLDRFIAAELRKPR